MNFPKTLAAAALALSASVGHAALHGRDADGNTANGFEAYYDDVLSLTWLADANRAYTTGQSLATHGEMTWQATQAWIAGTVNAGAGLYGVTDWHLPTTALVNPPHYTYNSGAADYYNGTADYSVNRSVASNQIGYHYYVNLGLLAWANTTGGANPASGLGSPGVTLSNLVYDSHHDLVMADVTTSGGLTFKQVSNTGFWTDSTVTNDPQVGSGQWALTLYTDPGTAGQMDVMPTTASAFPNTSAAWLVVDGDRFAVAAVPEPETYALMVAGLALLSVRRRQTRPLSR